MEQGKKLVKFGHVVIFEILLKIYSCSKILQGVHSIRLLNELMSIFYLRMALKHHNL